MSLGRVRRATFAALLPATLGLSPADAGRVPTAVGRLNDFHSVIPDRAAAEGITQALDVVAAFSVVLYGRLPARLDEQQVADFHQRLFFPDTAWPSNLLATARRIFGESVPSVRDIAKVWKELACIAWYGNPQSDQHTGFVPLWKRPQVLAVAPEEARARPYTRRARTRLDVPALRAALADNDTPSTRLFRSDGRPRIAIIGGGPGGAIAASRLADVADVAVFEKGPDLRPADFPTDNLAGMSLMYENALLYPTRDLDLRLLYARVLGGGSTMNEGVSVRPRKTTLDAWQRGGMGFDRGALNHAIDAVERRQRFTEYQDQQLTEAAHRFFEGAQHLPQIQVQRLRSDVASLPRQHGGQDRSGVRGEACLACGYCNYGCRFGHHLGIDRTYIRDLRKRGVPIHANCGVHRLVVRRLEGRWVVRGIKLSRSPRGRTVAVDGVVLAGGALGSAPILLRTATPSPACGVCRRGASWVGSWASTTACLCWRAGSPWPRRVGTGSRSAPSAPSPATRPSSWRTAS